MTTEQKPEQKGEEATTVEAKIFQAWKRAKDNCLQEAFLSRQGVGSFFLSPRVNNHALVRGGAGVPLCPIPAGSGMHKAAALWGSSGRARRGASPGRFLCLRPAGVSLKSRTGAGAARDRRAPAEPSGAVAAEERWPRWVPPQPPRSPPCPPDPPSSKPSPTPSSCRRL